MRRSLRRQFWLEAVLAGTTGALALVTAVWHEWIEVVSRVDPDAGSGALEWLVVAVLLVVTVVAGLMARDEFVWAPTTGPTALNGRALPSPTGPHDGP